MYNYNFPMFAYTTDVILTNWQRDKFIFIVRKDNGLLALPGGFVDIDERSIDAAYREVKEECGVDLLKIDRGFCGMYSFMIADAVDRDPRQRTISHIFIASCYNLELIFKQCRPGDDAKEVVLFEGMLDDHEFAFDHKEILKYAQKSSGYY